MKRALISLTLAATLATACGGSTPAGTGTAAKGPEAGNGEAAPIAYTDTRFHYRVDAPGAMKPTGDTTAAVVGPSERLEVTVIQGAGTDPALLAKSDLTKLATLTDYKLDSAPRAASISGRQVQKLVYEWTAGTSTVTGKAQHLTGVRYYIPKDASTIAVLTYGISSNQYDPQGADDIASSFRWQ